MSRADRSATLPAAVLLALMLIAGCAIGRKAERPGSGGIDVRLPVAESFEFTRKTAEPAAPAPPPFFEDDEYRYTGRWLTLFEVEVPSPGQLTPTASPAAPAEAR